MQGAGNDFIIIDDNQNLSFEDLQRLAHKLCDRHFGIGADGIILVGKSDKEVGECSMRISNADGSEEPMCGNGIRCLVKYVIDNGIVSNDINPVRVET
jgi:diaminopimelate epimerase